MMYQRNASVESAPMNDETLIYHPSAAKFWSLNGTAAFIWAQLSSPRSQADLVDGIARAFRGSSPDAIAEDVRGLLDEFARLAIIDQVNGAPVSGAQASLADESTSGSQSYSRPTLRLLDESDVLAEFQVASAGQTWWVM